MTQYAATQPVDVERETYVDEPRLDVPQAAMLVVGLSAGFWTLIGFSIALLV